MGLRLRKRVKIAPGVYLNVGKSGISASVGPRGATVNMKPGRKTRASIGVPGTGVSYSTTAEDKSMSFGRLLGWGFVVLIVLMLVFR